MKPRIRLIALPALLAAPWLPTAAADDRKVIDGLNRAWDDAFNRADAAALAALYDENATLSPGNGSTVKGRAAIQGVFQGAFDKGFGNHRIEIVEALLQGAFAYEIANWTARHMKDGVNDAYRGVLVHVFRKSGPNWLSVSHVWNGAKVA